MENDTVGAAADQRAAVAVDSRAGAAEVAAEFLAGRSPQVRARCSCPAAASAGAAVAGAAVAGASAAGSAGATIDCDAVVVAVSVAVIGDGCVVTVAVDVAGPDVVVLRKLLTTLSDSAAVAVVGVVGAIDFLEHS